MYLVRTSLSSLLTNLIHLGSAWVDPRRSMIFPVKSSPAARHPTKAISCAASLRLLVRRGEGWPMLGPEVLLFIRPVVADAYSRVCFEVPLLQTMPVAGLDILGFMICLRHPMIYSDNLWTIYDIFRYVMIPCVSMCFIWLTDVSSACSVQGSLHFFKLNSPR